MSLGTGQRRTFAVAHDLHGRLLQAVVEGQHPRNGPLRGVQLRGNPVADAGPHGRLAADARLLSGPLYGQRHDNVSGRAAPAHLAAHRLHLLGRRRQRILVVQQVRLGTYHAQLRHRLAVGVQEPCEHPCRLRYGRKGTRETNQRIFILHK